MTLSRRDLIRSSAVVGGIAALNLPGATAWAAKPKIRTKFTTLENTFGRGVVGAGGYAKLVKLPGEKHRVRTDLGARASKKRASKRKGVLAFAHLTDIHIIDAQSPARVEYVDRFDDAYAEGDPTVQGLFTSSYRPQEMLTAQVADQMVKNINRIERGPVTGKKLAFAIQTGDNSDNCQFNEVRWNIDVLDGERITPDSGDRTKYEGVSDSDDPHYYQPHKPGTFDIYQSRFGYPQIPKLLDAARRPFNAHGLDMPWYSVFGNHDGLVQGNFPHSLPLGLVATGPLKVDSVPTGLSQADLITSLKTADPTLLLGAAALSGGVRLVTADADRRTINRGEVIEEHFKTSGVPVGHGFTGENRAKKTAYYAFNKGKVRAIVLDTVNPNGYADGSIDAAQFDWLQAELAASGSRYVMIFSHHTSGTMSNPFVATGLDLSPRVLGGAVVELLLANRQVIAWVNGHTHRNEITAHSGPDGGFWEINSASHVDFPQQSRLIEVVDNRDKTLSIFTTMVNHAAPTSYGGKLGNTARLASLARELAANDPQHRFESPEGSRDDRNTELLIANPFA